MKKGLLFVILMAVVICTFATSLVSQEDAKNAAKNFMVELCQNENITLDYFTISEVVADANGEPLYYNFNMGDNGFIMVSATNLVTPILAYSFESRFEASEKTSYYVNKYKASIQQVKKNPMLQEASAIVDWNRYLASDFTPAKRRSTTMIEPMISTTWSQERYYNQYCPYDPVAPPERDRRAVVGCVSLNMINLMYYYRYPSKGLVGIGYVNDRYGTLQEDLRQHNYNYDYITDDISAYQYEFAKLIYHAGLTVQMHYGPESSGSTSPIVGGRMRNHFGFNAGIHVDRGNIAISKWEEDVIRELSTYRPLYYSGFSQSAGGHAWIVDGYININNQNYFHVNWGWRGSSNGFYKLDALTTPSLGSFSNGESFYSLLAPDTSLLRKEQFIDKRLTGRRGSISDGAGNMGYPLKAQYNWTIATPNATSYVLTPKKIKVLADDYITIYAYRGGQLVSVPIATWQGEYLMPGCSDSRGTIIAGYPGIQLPSSLSISADSILVSFTSVTELDSNTRFSTDVARHLTGININYRANNGPAHCSSTIIVVEREGFISDKSSSSVDQNTPYRGESECQWTIRLNQNQPDQAAIYYSFEHFDLGAGDVVDVYSNALTTTGVTLLHRFDKKNIPSGTYYHGGSRLHIVFNSDNYDEGTGFRLKYTGGYLGINSKHAGLNDLAIYPNPASDKLYTELSTDKAGKITFQVLDLTGRVVATEIVNHFGGELKHETSVTGFANGMYFMRVSTETGDVTRKFIVK